jgi:hypothetical protein
MDAERIGLNAKDYRGEYSNYGLSFQEESSSILDFKPIRIEKVKTFEDFIESKQEVYKFWQIEYYRPYFDVDTWTVISRLKYPFIPFKSDDFFEMRIDLYTPFWVVTTLVFLLAAVGNFALYIEKEGKFNWGSEITKLIQAGTILYSFSLMLPGLSYCIISADEEVSMIRIISVNGYSLLPYIPAVLICIIPNDWVRYLSLYVASFLSTWLVGKYILRFEMLGKYKKYSLMGMYSLGHMVLILLANWYFFATVTPTQQLAEEVIDNLS